MGMDSEPGGFGAFGALVAFPFPGALLKLLDCVAKAAVPVAYMLWPPTVEEREESMERDEKGVGRPRGRRGKGKGVRVGMDSRNVDGSVDADADADGDIDPQWLWMDVIELVFVSWSCCPWR